MRAEGKDFLQVFKEVLWASNMIIEIIKDYDKEQVGIAICSALDFWTASKEGRDSVALAGEIYEKMRDVNAEFGRLGGISPGK